MRTFTSVTIDPELFQARQGQFHSSTATDLGYLLLLTLPKDEVVQMIQNIENEKYKEVKNRLLKKIKKKG